VKVLLIRHGETAGNRERRYVGHNDEPLSAEGERQVRQMGICVEARQVFSSPLARAVQTARLLFPQAELILLPGLCEMDFGVFAGRAAGELRHDPAYREWLNSGCTMPCPGGEGMPGFTERVCAAFARAVSLSMENGSAYLAIVAHGGVLMAVMSRWARPVRPYFDWQVKPATGFSALLDEHTWQENPLLTDYAELTELGL